MIIWNEIQYGKKIYDEKITKTKKYQNKELKCLIYYLLSVKHKPKQIKEILNECCQDNIKYLTEEQKDVIFQKLINQCKKKKLPNRNVIVYKSELETIKNINNDKLERLVFVLLVYGKWLDSDWISITKSDLFRESGLTKINSVSQQDLLHQLFETGLVKSDVIKLNKKYGGKSNTVKKQMWRLNLKSNKDEFGFEINTFNGFVFRYLIYFGDNNYYECNSCQGIFKQNKSKDKKYCDDCRKDYRKKYKTENKRKKRKCRQSIQKTDV